MKKSIYFIISFAIILTGNLTLAMDNYESDKSPKNLKTIALKKVVNLLLANPQNLLHELTIKLTNDLKIEIDDFLKKEIIHHLLELTSTVVLNHIYCSSTLVFSPDKRFALTYTHNNIIKLWNLDNINSQYAILLNEHTGLITSIAFSPNGKFALSGSQDCSAILWNIEDKNNITSVKLIGHKKPVLSVAFSPNGKFILTGSSDCTAKLWLIKDLHDINPVEIFNQEYPVNSVSFSSDSKFAFTNSLYDDGTENITIRWNLDPIFSIDQLVLITKLLTLTSTPGQSISSLLNEPFYKDIFMSMNENLKSKLIEKFRLPSLKNNGSCTII